MSRRPAVLISACLLGLDCRYDGGSNLCGEVSRLMELAELIPVCPEQLGGLPTPREPSERLDGGVVTRGGTDVTAQFNRGAKQAARIAEMFGARHAVLKARSPSCGARNIYDGSFSGKVIPGMGVAAELLCQSGLRLWDETQLEELIALLRGE